MVKVLEERGIHVSKVGVAKAKLKAEVLLGGGGFKAVGGGGGFAAGMVHSTPLVRVYL